MSSQDLHFVSAKYGQFPSQNLWWGGGSLTVDSRKNMDVYKVQLSSGNLVIAGPEVRNGYKNNLSLGITWNLLYVSSHLILWILYFKDIICIISLNPHKKLYDVWMDCHFYFANKETEAQINGHNHLVTGISALPQWIVHSALHLTYSFHSGPFPTPVKKANHISIWKKRMKSAASKRPQSIFWFQHYIPNNLLFFN